jgi:glycosyltransferase involved in cell wall biosynthesis
LEFLQRIRNKGYTASVLLGKAPIGMEDRLSAADINVRIASTWDIVSGITRTPYPILRNIAGFIRRINPDVVHVNSHLFVSNYRAIAEARCMGIASVVTVHGLMADRGAILNALQRVYLLTVAKSLFKKVSAILCLTKSDAESVAGIINCSSKISVIPNGVDTDFFKPSNMKDPNLVTWVGRLVPEKGVLYLLKAVHEVRKVRASARLVLVGDGPFKAELQQFADALGLGDRVQFVGALSRIEVAKLLSMSSVFVFPSLKEGLPSSVMEAMACGVPVVGSDIPGVSDVVVQGETGLLVRPKNSEALANAILTLMNDENMQNEFGRKGRELMIQRYSWNTVIRRMESIYREAGAA